MPGPQESGRGTRTDDHAASSGQKQVRRHKVCIAMYSSAAKGLKASVGVANVRGALNPPHYISRPRHPVVQVSSRESGVRSVCRALDPLRCISRPRLPGVQVPSKERGVVNVGGALDPPHYISRIIRRSKGKEESVETAVRKRKCCRDSEACRRKEISRKEAKMVENMLCL